MNLISKSVRVFVLSYMLAGVNPVAHALNLQGAVGLDVAHTDNAALTATNEVNDTVVTGRLEASVSESRGPVTGDFNAAVRRQKYLDNTFGDETYLDVGTQVQWEQIRNRLIWRVEDYYDQISQNTLAGDTPSNLEDTNAFRIIADAIFPIADRHTLTVTPSFADYYFEKSNNDNQQIGIGAGWAYQFSPSAVVNLTGDFTEVDYETDTLAAGVSADHDRYVAWYRFAGRAF